MSHSHSGACTDPYWGAPTASVDWCEENYLHSCFVAESWNTLTSFLIFIPSLVGVWSIFKHKLEKRFLVMYLCVVVVGLGSVAFHATLSFVGQLLDELPMQVGAIIYFRNSMEDGKKLKYPYLSASLTAFTVLYCLASITTHQTPLFFQVLWVAMVLLLIRYQMQDYRRCKNASVRRFFVFNMSMLALGAACWLVDTHMCDFILKLPMRVFIQLHALWHILSGMGVHSGVVFQTWVRIELTYGQGTGEIAWVGPWPYARLRADYKAVQHQAAEAEKVTQTAVAAAEDESKAPTSPTFASAGDQSTIERKKTAAPANPQEEKEEKSGEEEEAEKKPKKSSGRKKKD